LVCRTPRGCVDWNYIYKLITSEEVMSHPAWVRGLKRVK